MESYLNSLIGKFFKVSRSGYTDVFKVQLLKDCLTGEFYDILESRNSGSGYHFIRITTVRAVSCFINIQTLKEKGILKEITEEEFNTFVEEVRHLILTTNE